MKMQSSRRDDAGQVDARRGSAGLSATDVAQASPEAKESDAGQARETQRVEELLSRVRYSFRNIYKYFSESLVLYCWL